MLSIIYAEADSDHHSLLLFLKVAENKPPGGMETIDNCSVNVATEKIDSC